VALRIRYKVWIEREGRVLFGHGRLELLRALDRKGSLAKAAEAMGMSYRAAWGRIKASEERLGFSLVEHGPQGKRMSKLTSEGRALLDWLADLERDLDRFLEQALERRPDCLKRGAPATPARLFFVLLEGKNTTG
jgi:molybdate transport system regulatory protein